MPAKGQYKKPVKTEAEQLAADLLHRVRMIAGTAVEKGMTETDWLNTCRSAFEWADDDLDLGQDTLHRETREDW